MENMLKQLFGLSISIKEIEAPVGLPLYMTADRSFYTAEFDGIKFLIVEIKELDKFGAIALEKQLKKYMDASGLNAAYLISGITKAQRDGLIRKMIPFISQPDHLFLPFLGIMLSNRFIKQKKLDVNRFSPAAQCLFLYFLYKKTDGYVLKKDVAEELGVTRMMISRASEQLAAMGLLKEEKAGKEVRMTPSAKGKTYYEMGKTYLINPVTKVLTVEMENRFSDFPVAGESALAERTMLSNPSIPVIAVGRDNSVLQSTKVIDGKWALYRNLVQLQVWKYDPALFTVEGIVDPVSMAASLSEIDDERVQGELEDYMEEIEW